MDLSRAPTLAAALLSVQEQRESGTLEVRAGSTRTDVYFASGTLVFAEQGSLGDALGRVLVREGRLTSDQYAAAIRHMTRKLVDSEEIRFGEAVVELGFLGVDDIQEALAAQVRHKVVHCLMHEEAEWTFRRSSERHGVGHFPMRVEPQILAAARLFEEQRVEKILDLEQRRYPCLLGDAEELARTFEMKPDEARFLRSIDGTIAADEALRAASSAGAAAILAAVVLAGRVDLRSHPAPKPGVRPPPLPAQAKPAPAPPAPAPPAPAKAAPPPPSPAKPGPPPLPRPAQHPLRVLTPFDPSAPIPVDPRAARLLAEHAFQNAKQHLRNQEVGRALPELRRAAEYCSDSPEFLLYLNWAEFTSAAGNAAQAAERRANLRLIAAQAVKKDPNLAFGFFVLGQLGMLDGEDPKKTMRHLQHALRLDPGLVDAQRYLRLAKARAGRQ